MPKQTKKPRKAFDRYNRVFNSACDAYIEFREETGEHGPRTEALGHAIRKLLHFLKNMNHDLDRTIEDEGRSDNY